MATFGRRRDRARGPRTQASAPPRRRPAESRARRPVLTLVHGGGSRTGPVPLREVGRSPMPAHARGALVTAVDHATGGRLQVVWASRGAPGRIPPGQVMLSWVPDGTGRMDVTARLGLVGGQVLLATWPGLNGDWTDVVRPTVAEVRELHAALRLATVVLERVGGSGCAGTGGTEGPDCFPGA
ncbi:hypothetical protein ACWEWD_34205 [Streptomyces tendae]